MTETDGRNDRQTDRAEERIKDGGYGRRAAGTRQRSAGRRARAWAGGIRNQIALLLHIWLKEALSRCRTEDGSARVAAADVFLPLFMLFKMRRRKRRRVRELL